MNSRIRIAVADDEPDMQEYFEKILSRMGHTVVSVAENGAQLVEHCRIQKPDLVISDINMPVMDGIEAATRVFQERPTPFILVSAYHDQSLIERAEVDHVMSYLIKPIKQADLEPAIAIAMRRFSQFQALRKEANDLRQALADRKQIERAKGILMKRTGLDEPDAFRRLQKLASEKNLKLAEIAGQILTAEEAFSTSNGDGKP
jgi:AmiR/NasT family two-component response regulator